MQFFCYKLSMEVGLIGSFCLSVVFYSEEMKVVLDPKFQEHDA